MEKRRNKYVIFLYMLLGFSVGLFVWAAYVYYQNSIPDTIRIKAGTSEEINLKIPASGVIEADAANVITLNHPVTFVAGNTMDSYQMNLKLFGVLPLKSIDIEVIEDTKLIPVGKPIGIYVKTKGTLVVDTGSFEGTDGISYAPAEYKLQTGDYLVTMDGIEITGKKQVKEYIQEQGEKEIIFEVIRNEEMIEVKIKPVYDRNESCKIGVWLRDNAQGIGTMTYLDENNRFGALGHGINDTDTGELLTLGSGLLYRTEIIAVLKGERGKPGELTGIIEYQPENVYGVITRNTGEGIYGVTTDNMDTDFMTDALPVGLKQEVRLGEAKILCNVNGEDKYYNIEITKLTMNSENINRQISLTVTDSQLLEMTGGIVQGMSGAPIIQNDKIIGAVTHVLVQDSTKGYGIFIENMMNNSY